MVKVKATILERIWLKACVMLIVFMAAYWIPLKAIVKTWWNNEDYSYGFLVPIISAYFLWDKRRTLGEISIKSSWKLLPGLIFFILVSIYGILGSSGNISMPSVPIVIILLVAFCFGMEALRRLILPLGFLIFMVPIPPSVELSIGVWLKSISSKLGGMIISLFNIPVHVSGNIIDLGVTQLQVVDACSGLRYLFPLFALGIVYAYFFERVAWKRFVCVLATIPIAVITNALRIGITGILTNWYGAKVAEGFFHGSSAIVLFIAAFAFLFLVGLILSFFPPSRHSIKKSTKFENIFIDLPAENKQNINAAFFTAIVLLIFVGGLSLSTKALPAVKIRGGIESFPLTFADWQGKSETVDPEIIAKSGAEESFGGFYRSEKYKEISLYIGYRSTAFLSNENFFHSPTVCLPASGWKDLGTSTYIIKEVPLFGQLKVTKMMIQNMSGRQLAYFWFQTKNRATSDKNINRFHLSLHAIKRDNTHDLFIRPITPIYPGETIQDAEKRMDQFVREMMTALLQFLKERQYEGK